MGVLEVNSSVQLAPGATLAQLVSSTDRLGHAALLLTVIALAFSVLLMLLVISKDRGAPDTVTIRLCSIGFVILICG